MGLNRRRIVDYGGQSLGENRRLHCEGLEAAGPILRRLFETRILEASDGVGDFCMQNSSGLIIKGRCRLREVYRNPYGHQITLRTRGSGTEIERDGLGGWRLKPPFFDALVYLHVDEHRKITEPLIVINMRYLRRYPGLLSRMADSQLIFNAYDFSDWPRWVVPYSDPLYTPRPRWAEIERVPELDLILRDLNKGFFDVVRLQ